MEKALPGWRQGIADNAFAQTDIVPAVVQTFQAFVAKIETETL